MFKNILLLSLSLLITSCNFFSTPNIQGHWKFHLNLKDDKKLPFILTINDKNQATLYNSTEKFELNIENLGENKYKIPLHVFDAGLEFTFQYNEKNKAATEQHILVGDWIKYYKDEYKVPFIAQKILNPQIYNYDLTSKPKTIIPTLWSIEFDDESKSKVIGNFIQVGNRIRGTLLSDVGDYRYLEGKIIDNEFELYGFDGIFAMVFNAKFDDKKISGKFWSGKNHFANFSGFADSKAVLPDPYKLAKIKDSKTSINFELENYLGEKISLTKFENKVKIIMISGTWCPNCMDEAKFMSEWYEQNKHRNVEVFSLFFERAKSKEHANKLIGHFAKAFNLNYHLLLGSFDDSVKPEVIIPQIDKIYSYPTTIFLDKNNQIQKIHSGFSGPSTGVYFEKFKTEFNFLIEQLLDS